MSRQQSGVVLLTTIMMIVVLTLLVLSLMQGVLLYIKGNNQIEVNHQTLYQMEAVANQLDLTNEACVVKDKTPNQLMSMVSSQQGCRFVDGDRDYLYLLEDLGLFPCLQILRNETPQGSHHWLMTLARTKPPHLVLQWRVAAPAKTQVCELGAVHTIHQGVISWRKINFSLDRNQMRDKIFY